MHGSRPASSAKKFPVHEDYVYIDAPNYLKCVMYVWAGLQVNQGEACRARSRQSLLAKQISKNGAGAIMLGM